jgi:hypothetical protein
MSHVRLSVDSRVRVFPLRNPVSPAGVVISSSAKEDL